MAKKKDHFTIPIDPEGRYVIITKNFSEQQGIALREMIAKWWNSTEKFLIINIPEIMKAAFHRVDDPKVIDFPEELRNYEQPEAKETMVEAYIRSHPKEIAEIVEEINKHV